VRMDKAYESWEILDAGGRIIRSGRVNTFPIETIDTGELPAGLYFVRLQSHSAQSVVKVCVGR